MAALHTPGPFAVEAPIDGSLMIVEAGKPVHKWRPVAILPLADEKGAIPNDQVLANALLFAAGPELYATLEYLLPHLAELDRAERHRNRDNPTAVLHAQVCINNVQNALAKARGGL